MDLFQSTRIFGKTYTSHHTPHITTHTHDCRSLSFILAMAGSGFILLAIFYFTIDVILWWNGAPFKYPGTYIII